MWDLATSRRLARLNGHTKSVHSVDFSADNTLLASSSGDQTVKIWDIQSLHPSSSPSSSDLTLSSEPSNTVKEPTEIRSFPAKHTPVFAVQFTRRNLLLASGPFLPQQTQ